MKPWYRSRIIWLNVAVAGMSAAVATGQLPAGVAAFLTVLGAMANVVLRYDTTDTIE